MASHVEVLTPAERAALAGRAAGSPVGTGGVAAGAPAAALAGKEDSVPLDPADGDVAADGPAAAGTGAGGAAEVTTEQQFQIAANRLAALCCNTIPWFKQSVWHSRPTARYAD